MNNHKQIKTRKISAKKLEEINKYQMKISGSKNILSETKSSVDGLKSRMEGIEGIINELEYKTITLSSLKERKWAEEELKEPQGSEGHNKRSKTHVFRVLVGKGRAEKVLREIMAENLAHLERYIKLQI